MTKNKILVTGCAGFIGARTAKSLLSEGAVVFGVDNLNDYYDIRIKDYRLDRLKKFKNFQFERVDVADLPAVEKVFCHTKYDVVIHLAGMAGVRYSLENPEIYLRANAFGTLNILESMKKHQVKKMVTASTSSLYAGQKMPFKETLPVNTPISPYAASKKAAEVMAYTYHHLYDIDITVLRYFTVFGPAGRPDMSYFRFIKWIDEGKPLKLYGDGNQSRDFTYVDDIARGTILAAKNLGYEIINLGGGQKPVTINYMISKIEEFLGKKAKIEYLPMNKADMEATSADISKAKKLLGWQPEVSFEEGLKRAVDWYEKNRKWLREIRV